MAKPKNYTWEQRERILKRTLPPENMNITDLSKEIGVTTTTLHNWRKKINAVNSGHSSSNKEVTNWSSADKFHIVMETYALNEVELGAYCREKGLYIEEVNAWRKQCLQANHSRYPKDVDEIQNQLREEKNRSKELAKELARKEKALAEAAALLVLRKKAQAVWEDNGED